MNRRTIRFILLLCLGALSIQCDVNKKKADGNVSSVNKILIINKGGDGRHSLKKRAVVTDKNEIARLMSSFLESEKLTQKVNLGANYGSIIVDMLGDDSKSLYYLSIVYTVYDGVVIRNDYNGDRLKNDKFVGNINNLISDDKITLENLNQVI